MTEQLNNNQLTNDAIGKRISTGKRINQPSQNVQEQQLDEPVQLSIREEHLSYDTSKMLYNGDAQVVYEGAGSVYTFNQSRVDENSAYLALGAGTEHTHSVTVSNDIMGTQLDTTLTGTAKAEVSFEGYAEINNESVHVESTFYAGAEATGQVEFTDGNTSIAIEGSVYAKSEGELTMVANREEITARGGASAGYGQSLGTEVSHRTDSGSSFSFSGSGSAGVQAGALYGITARNNEEGLTFGADFDIKVLGG